MRQPVPFGKYLLLERISVGGMAEVFKAKAFGVEGFEKILAIKRILPSMAEDADFIQMFIDEAKIAGQLNHANVAQIFELGRFDESHFIAMEFVWGKDLLQIQNRFRRMKQTMPFAMAAFCAAKMCEGLDYAHKKKDAGGRSLGIIHRDVSPQNVLVSYDGEVKVIDFGIAKAASRSTKTQAGVLKGKFGYMSPEQVRGLPLDRRSDVFAIATILYELLTAERLFLGESDFATLEKVRNVDVPKPSQQVPGCPPAIERIILRGLSKDVEDRYQWASEMQEELQTYLGSLEPAFGMKQLGAWMKEQFAAELKRESQVLEEQKRMGRDGKVPGAAPPVPRPTIMPGGIPPVAVPPIAAARKPTAPVANATFNLSAADLLKEDDDIVSDLEMDEIDDGAEEAPPISGEATIVSAELPPEVKAVLAAAAANGAPQAAGGMARPVAKPLSAESTQILGAGHPALPGMPPPASFPPPSELPAQATMILDTSSGPGAAPLPSQNTVMLEAPSYPPPRAVTAAMPQIEANPPTSHVTSPQFRPARKSTLARDLLTGVAVAVAVVGAVLGVRIYLTRHTVQHGTLVVTVSPSMPATVSVDGVEKGAITPGAALTLRDLKAGHHQVEVKAAAGSFDQPVTIVANDVSVVAAAIKVAEPADNPNATGRFKIELAGDGATVWIDGAQLEEGAWKEQIPLRAGKPHEFKITKAGMEDVKFSVTLKNGEEQSRAVTFVPATGHIEVNTDPSGADVSVNGKPAGTTPLKLDDLDIAKETRVTIRKSGYSAITKYVSFKQDNHQVFSLKLMTSTGSASPDDAPMVAVSDKPAAPAAEKHAPPADDDDLAPTKPARPVQAAASDDKGGSANDPGFLVANTQPWAKVLIDNKDTGKTTPIAPRSKIPLKPGKHLVTFVANGKKYDFDVQIKSGEDYRLIRQLDAN